MIIREAKEGLKIDDTEADDTEMVTDDKINSNFW